MAAPGLDPNRFAIGVEAAIISNRARVEKATVAIATERCDVAQEALRDAKARFAEAEAAYNLCKAALDDAAAYAALATEQLSASVAQLAASTALLHPVRKLPFELLSIIFGLCLDDLPVGGDLMDVEEATVRARQVQAFKLAAVCRRFRQASLSCPSAWNTLELLLDDVRDNEQVWMDYIDCVLSRSASAPVDIRIGRWRANKEGDKNILDHIHHAIPRCSSLFVYCSDILDASDPLVPFLTTATPILHTLHLDVQCRSIGLQASPLLPDAPKLRHVHTTAAPCVTQPPFKTISSLVLDASVISATPMRDDLAVLAHMAPTLVCLTLMYPSAEATLHHEPVVLPNSRLCIVHGFDDGKAVEFVRQLRQPHLDWLKFCGPTEGSAERIRMLAAILPHSPAVTWLSFSTVRVEDFDALCRALPLARALATLWIRKTSFTRPTLRLLCDTLGRPAAGDAAWACPALTLIELSTCTFASDCAMDDVVQLVSRRLAAASAPEEEGKRRLTRLLAVRLPTETNPAVTAQLEALLDDEE